MQSLKNLAILILAAAASTVSGHAAIVSAVGDAGGSGSALGVEAGTPRDGTRRNPFQQDSTRFRGAAAATFGETLGGGDNRLEAGTRAIMAGTGNDVLPQVTAGGALTMTVHQVNADGAGPYQCMISADGTGAEWVGIPVVQNVPGRRGRDRVSFFFFFFFRFVFILYLGGFVSLTKNLTVCSKAKLLISPSRPPSPPPRLALAPLRARRMCAWCAARTRRGRGRLGGLFLSRW